jgi:hypothetical protein
MKRPDPDADKGAIEGDRPDDVQEFNPNAGALDENGLPGRMVPICEDVIGANIDQRDRHAGTAGAAVDANERGETSPHEE